MTDPIQELHARLAADRVTTTRAQEVANNATPGPWVHYYPGQCCQEACIVHDEQPWGPLHGIDAIGHADAEFIAESRTLVPALVALVDARDAAIQAVLDACDLAEQEGHYAAWGPIRAAVVSALDGNGQPYRSPVCADGGICYGCQDCQRPDPDDSQESAR